MPQGQGGGRSLEIEILEIEIEEGAVEENQKQQPYRDRNSHSSAAPVFQGEQDAEEIVPGVPIVRSNTPRPSAFDAMVSSTGYLQKPQRSDSLEFEASEL